MVDAGNTRQTAKRVVLSSSGLAGYRDTLNATDRNDYYRVDLSIRRSLSVKLSKLGASADLALYGRDGRLITSSRKSATREENINRTLNPGTYYYRVFTPAGVVSDTSYSLNISSFVDRAGNTTTTARSIGDITETSSRKDYGDFVGVSDISDYYKFSVSDRKTVNFSLRGLRGDADLYLRDSAGTIIQRSTNTNAADELIVRALNGPLTNGDPVNDPSRPVTYFLQVVPKSGVNTRYTLGVSTGPEAGATVEKARNISLTFDDRTYRDALGDGDNLDLYSFSVNTPSTFNLRLDGLNATLNADVQLYRNDGSIAPFTPANLITSSINGGAGVAESISNQSLDTGDYLIRVSRFSNTGNSTYNLTVSGLPGDRAPNTIQTARPLVLSDTNIRAPFTLTGADGSPEFIGPADRIDLYKVDLDSDGDRTFLSVKLNNLQNGTADLLLLQDTNSNGRIDDTNGSGGLDEADSEVISISARTGSSAETIGGTFLDGTYYIFVRPGVEGQSSFYDLSTYTAPGGTVPSITKDILFGAGSSDPRELTDVNGSLYFIANDGDGYALWKSEGVISNRLGTVQATTKVKAIKSGATSTDISSLTNLNGTLYFAADDGANGTELWKSDGTAAGTVLVKNINAAVGSSSLPRSLTVVGDTLYFVASNQGGNFELWKSDGTEAGTVQVSDLAAGLVSSSPANLTNVNGTLFFTANAGATGTELYRLNPSSTTPQLLDIATTGTTNSFPGNLTVVNNTGLYFTARTDANGLEVWKIGAGGNPVRVTDLGLGLLGSGATNLTSVGSKLYFTAVDSNSNNQLWSIDTANADTLTQLTTVDGGADPTSLVNVDGTLYFAATNGANGREIWSTNGTALGTTAKTNIDFSDFNPSSLIDVNGVLYFTANNGESGNELWRYNPSESNPQAELVSDIIPGSVGSNPEDLTNISGRLFFRADNSFDENEDGTLDETEGNGIELWGL